MTQKRNRRARGDGCVVWDEKRNRWVAVANVGYKENGRPIRKKASGTSKSAALAALRKTVAEYHNVQAKNISSAPQKTARYTIFHAANDWLTATHNWAPKTNKRNIWICRDHIIPELGHIELDKLLVTDVDQWLQRKSQALATSSLLRLRAVLSAVIDWAVACDKINRNVASVCTVPNGKPGRPSKALTLKQAEAVLAHTATDPFYPYIVTALLTGVRTEEVRALRWDRVHLDAHPPRVEVWRATRHSGDTKTLKSRRTLELPDLVVQTLRRLHTRQLIKNPSLPSDAPVFPHPIRCDDVMTKDNARDALRRALKKVPGMDPKEWAPRELRHSFTSLLSEQGVTTEEIARLLGHSNTRTTEKVYRKELRPVLQSGTASMNELFPITPTPPDEPSP